MGRDNGMGRGRVVQKPSDELKSVAVNDVLAYTWCGGSGVGGVWGRGTSLC